MASKAAQKRLTKEYVAMEREPPPFVWATPDEKNILNWNYIIRGPPDSPFAGGEYHGMLLFPPEYPFKPPGIKMLTPSGRFQPDRKICFSMSDFHPGTWNPTWSVSTILTGLLSFMLSDEITTGAIKATEAQKRYYAQKSHGWNLGQVRFKEAFPDFCDPIMKDLPNMGQPSSPPTATPVIPATTPVLSGTASSSTNSLITSNTNGAMRSSTNTLNDEIRNSSSGTSASSSVASLFDNNATPGLPPGQPQGAAVAGTGGANNWIDSWIRVLGEKWRWAAVIMLAVIVSRVSSK